MAPSTAPALDSGHPPSARRAASPQDGSRPSPALRVDALKDLKVYDAGDVPVYSGDMAESVKRTESAVFEIVSSGAVPVVLGGDHTVAWPLPVVGLDLVEVSPPFDHADVTALLGNRVVPEELSAIARRRKDQRDGTTWDPRQPLLHGREPTSNSPASPPGTSVGTAMPRSDSESSPPERPAGAPR